MALTNEEILEAIASKSVLEISELIKMMEDKFGVSAAAAAVAVAGPAAAAAPAAAAPAPKPQGMQPEIVAAITAALSEEVGISSRSMNIVNIKKI